MNALRCLTFIILLTQSRVFSDNVCEEEGTCDMKCEDLDLDCADWAKDRQCEENPSYMLKFCAKSCKACGGGEMEDIFEDEYLEEDEDDLDYDGEILDEYGVVQHMDEAYREEILKAIEDMRLYFEEARSDPGTTPKMHTILDNCKNQHASCAFWKVMGECEANPEYMKKSCAPMCLSCEFLSLEFRCPLDPDAPDAWKPGDLNTFFLNITTLPEFAKYEPRILSRPDYVNGDTEETADYEVGPWVVTLENFVTDEEADRLIQLGAEEGYERSKDVGEVKFDGTFDDVEDEGRTSLNAWCDNKCYNDTAAKQVIARIEEITNIPETNSEYLQLLKYDVGQFYSTHHDYIEFDVDRQSGVRILTVFLYLNDVEAGGGTDFPSLGLTVMPKKGRALIWPSVLDSDPNRKDFRTEHQALPVEKGIKYGANAWLHLRDYKTPDEKGCL
ncbi:ShK toxin domain [Fragilaria crotonensis]|nr:ShK toxin domain [Fragilaria crotonensis]